MNKILFLCFEEKDLLGAEIQDLRAQFGDAVFESVFPKTKEEHAALCASESIVGVVLHPKTPIGIIDPATARKTLHVMFKYASFRGSPNRLLQQVSGITIDVHPLPIRKTELEDAA